MRHARVLAVSALATAVVVAAAAFAQTTLTPLPDNGFKIPMLRRTMVSVLRDLTEEVR